ncbi:hypothetical protein NLJ89_g11367 [Agrocybe chaxingu]|uniref:EF-hand domain-containing protein n=1 Tax=Agrocybe chaxingu TaxID=84603 RepID=A0A9W8MQ26_9AGAR|nr:hypothetical protein NLJ89_g11367 [Agrocybe chaxingu]
MEKVERGVWRAGKSVLVLVGLTKEKADRLGAFGLGRSKFEGGELAALRYAFATRTTKNGDGVEKVGTEEILELLKDVPGYSEVSKKELDYVLDEAGFKDGQVNFDEFIEICGNLKEVSFTPSSATSRMTIPVEKSGGGV